MLAQPQRGWPDAPRFVWIELARALDAPDLARAACVCAGWRAAVRDLWAADGILFRNSGSILADGAAAASFQRFVAARGWRGVADRLPRLQMPGTPEFGLESAAALDLVRACPALRGLDAIISPAGAGGGAATDELLAYSDHRFHFVCSDAAQAERAVAGLVRARGRAASAEFRNVVVPAPLLRALADVLADPACQLERVDFIAEDSEGPARLVLYNSDADRVLDFWAQVLPRNTSLRSLHLNKFHCEERMSAVLDAFAAHSMTTLTISQCDLRGTGAGLAAAVARAVVVDLSANIMGREARARFSVSARRPSRPRAGARPAAGRARGVRRVGRRDRGAAAERRRRVARQP